MDRPVLVTGASSGIGLATVLHLGRLGFRAIGSVRSEDKVDTLAKASKQAGVDVQIEVFDVTDAQATQRIVPGLGLYGLVNNAGYYNVGAIEDVAPDDVRRQLEAMVLAPMRLAQLAIPSMRWSGQGRIVNISSPTAQLTGALTGWYQASKHALSAVSDALRMEVASAGVEVVLIEPGGIRTNIWRKAEQDMLRRREGSVYRDSYDRALRILHVLEDRMHPPSDVAEVIGRALTAGRPRAHYRVGRDAAALEWADSLLPSRVKDRAARAALGLWAEG